MRKEKKIGQFLICLCFLVSLKEVRVSNTPGDQAGSNRTRIVKSLSSRSCLRANSYHLSSALIKFEPTQIFMRFEEIFRSFDRQMMSTFAYLLSQFGRAMMILNRVEK